MVKTMEQRMNQTEPYAQWLIDNPKTLEDVDAESWEEIDEAVSKARADEISDKRFGDQMNRMKNWISDQPRKPVLRKTQPEEVKTVIDEDATKHSKEDIGSLALSRMRHTTRTVKNDDGTVKTEGQTFRVNLKTARKIVYKARKTLLDKAYRDGSWNGLKPTIKAQVDEALSVFKGDI